MAENSYNASNITVLEGLEAVRKRPGMYIGSTGERGLHHLVYEVVDNSVDEALAGYCTEINITLMADGGVEVIDNGRGIPVDIHPVEKKPALEVVLTVLHAGGKFGDDGSGYEASGGLHGVGASCVNFLSVNLDVEVYRDKKKYQLSFERGIPVNSVKEIGSSNATGTKISFTPDYNIFGQFAVEDAFRENIVDDFDIDEIFAECSGKWRKALINSPVDIDVFKQCFKLMDYEDTVYVQAFNSWFNNSYKNIQFDETVLVRRLRETAYLNGGLKIVYDNKHTGTKEEFYFEGGIADYVSYLASTRSSPYPSKPFYFENKSGKVNVQVSFQYSEDDDETIYALLNYLIDLGLIVFTENDSFEWQGLSKDVERVEKIRVMQTDFLRMSQSEPGFALPFFVRIDIELPTLESLIETKEKKAKSKIISQPESSSDLSNLQIVKKWGSQLRPFLDIEQKTIARLRNDFTSQEDAQWLFSYILNKIRKKSPAKKWEQISRKRHR